MAVAIDADGTAQVTSGAGTSTSIDYTGITVGSGANLGLVAMVHIDSVASPGTVAATWDNGGTNQAMTQLASSVGSTRNTYIFGLAAPTSGNKTLRVTWTTGADAVVNASSFTGVDQTGGTTSFPNATSNTGSSTTSTITITSAAGDAAIANHSASSTTAFSAVNNTQIYLDTLVHNIRGSGNRAAGAATVTLTATLAVGTWRVTGTSIKAAAAAAAQVPYTPWPQLGPTLAQ